MPDDDTTADDDAPSYDQPFRIGDPVMDLAQGRPMIVLGAPDTTVETWSDRNDYDLEANYANSKFQPHASEPVVECVYVSDVRSEPSKTYTFPISRCKLIDAHHADDGPRVAARVLATFAEDLLETAAADDTLPAVARVAAMLHHSLDGGAAADRVAEVADALQQREVSDE
jgi:hypothetical protein